MIRKLHNDSHGAVRGLETSEPGGRRPAARARRDSMVLLMTVAAMAAMSSMAAQAQIHISNDVSTNVFSNGITQGTVGSQGTLHLVQPFRTPAGSGKRINLENVVLHFTNMPLATSQVKLYLYRSKPNPNPPVPPAFAPTVPDAGTIDQTTHALPVNDPGRILEFRTPTRLGGNRYRFAAPGNTVLSAGTTYHLYLWSVPHVDGPRWKTVDIAATPGGGPGNVDFTGNAFQCSSGWTLLRGLRDDPLITSDEGWFPYDKNTFVTEIIGRPNHDPGQPPTIGGAARVGEELTVHTSSIMDDNGAPSSGFTYQWMRVDADGVSNPEDIAGATAQTYTLVEDDQGRKVQVKVRFTDDDCYENEALSVLSGVVSEANVPATGLAMSGRAKVGETLTAEVDGIEDPNGLTPPVSYTYRWARVDADGASNPEDIAGATSQTHDLREDDLGKRVRVTVRFNDDDGNPEALRALSGVVSEANVPAPEGGLRISGTAQVGETLTAEVGGIEDPDGLTPPVSYTYQWARVDADGASNPEDVVGATSQTHDLREDDLGKRVRVTVRFNDDDGNPEALTVLSGVVAARDNVPATGLAMSGTAQIGETLTAETGGIEDPDGLTPPVSYTYQWARVDADGASNPEDIAGATSQTHDLGEDDLGRRVRVTVRFNDDDGNPEALGALSGVVLSRITEESEVVKGELTRFGETVAGQVLDGVQRRFEAPRVPGVRTTFAGQHVDWSRASRDPDREGVAANTVRALGTLSGRELLTGSSLLFSGETARGGGYTSVWAQGAYGAYAGEDDGVEIDGSVRTGQLGADWTSGPWMLGVSVAHSVGESDYRGDGEGEIETSLTGIYPYARYEFTERNSIWAVTGRGEGSLKLKPKDGSSQGEVETDIGLTTGAAGLRVEVLEEDDDEAVAGISLAVKSDVMFVNMTSKEVTGRLSATSPETNRVRVGLEGSRRIVLENGATLIPSAEIGVRHDGGSVSAGTGADVGAGVVYANPAHGWSVDLKGRSLIAHETSGTREWGVSGAVRYEGDRFTERGLVASLDGGYGAQASGGADALFALDKLEDLEAGDGTLPGGRFHAEVGYGLPAFGNRFISRPRASLGLTETGSAWRLGWWVTPARTGLLNLSGGIDLDPRDEEYSIGLQLDARF